MSCPKKIFPHTPFAADVVGPCHQPTQARRCSNSGITVIALSINLLLLQFSHVNLFACLRLIRLTPHLDTLPSTLGEVNSLTYPKTRKNNNETKWKTILKWSLIAFNGWAREVSASHKVFERTARWWWRHTPLSLSYHPHEPNPKRDRTELEREGESESLKCFFVHFFFRLRFLSFLPFFRFVQTNKSVLIGFILSYCGRTHVGSSFFTSFTVWTIIVGRTTAGLYRVSSHTYINLIMFSLKGFRWEPTA